MKKLITYFFILFCVNAFAQKTYTFDYYTVYEIDNSNSKQYIIGNSNDSSYFTYIFAYNDVFSSMSLYDTKNDLQYDFDIKKRNINSVKSFTDIADSYMIYKYGFSEREKFFKDIFEIEYDPLNDEETIIVIKKYKNKRKKKLVYTNVFHVKDYSITKNQFYITNLIFGFSFDINKIKTTGVVIEQNVMFKKTPNENYTKTLTDIGQLDFSLNLETEPVITRTKTIIQIR
ncbi:MAG: hypothetical protein AB7D46_04935 [Flavobacteriaceae bacterium]